MRDLFSDYITHHADLMPFYAGVTQDLLKRAPRPRPLDPALIEVLKEYQAALGNARTIPDNAGVVITGQQPGLLTGPLYTIYKAATAVRLAAELESRHGVRYIPVFWVASADHDFDEVRTVHVLTKRHAIESHTYTPSSPVAGLPMYRVPVDASLHDIIDQMATSTTGSEFRDEIASFLHESLDAAQSFSDWFARILARLFRDTPLVLFSPHIPEARALAAPVLEWEIEHPLAPTNLLNAAGARLVTLGYKQQVVKEDTECNFFLEVDQRRCKVRYKDSRYIVPDARLSFSVDEMLSLLEAAPERFSSNVALRCLEQQHLFSPVAYVAGPSEVAYWGQLKPLFDCADLDMPVVYPRARCALTNLKLNALLSRFGFTLDDMELPHVELVERALESIVDDPRLAIVEKRRHDVSAALGALCDELEGVDKTFSEMARRVETRTYWGLDRLQNAIVRSDKEQVDAVTNQVTRLCNELYPFRKPQERVVNIFSYLFEYGWDLIPRIVQEIDVEEFALKEIEL